MIGPYTSWNCPSIPCKISSTWFSDGLAVLLTSLATTSVCNEKSLSDSWRPDQLIFDVIFRYPDVMDSLSTYDMKLSHISLRIDQVSLNEPKPK